MYHLSVSYVVDFVIQMFLFGQSSFIIYNCFNLPTYLIFLTYVRMLFDNLLFSPVRIDPASAAKSSAHPARWHATKGYTALSTKLLLVLQIRRFRRLLILRFRLWSRRLYRQVHHQLPFIISVLLIIVINSSSFDKRGNYADGPFERKGKN